MSKYPRILVALGGATALALVSCQTTTPEPEVPTTTILRFQEPAPALRPDSADWKLGGEGAAARPVAEADHPERFAAEVTLPRSPGRDTIKLSLWRYGLRTAVLPYAGAGPDLVENAVVRDQLARDLLVRHKAKHDTLPKAYPADPSGVRRVYAECLLSHESMCPDAAAPRPVGMDSTALVDELCRELARRKLSFASQIQTPFFAWTVPTWKQVVIGRVAKGVLTSQDSATLFPTELVVRQKSTIAQVMRAGGAAVPVGGRFAWNTSRKVEAFVEIRTLDGRVASGFTVVIPQPAAGDTSLLLDGRASLRAGAQVAAGPYQRTVGVRDDEGRVARWTDTFQVAAPDTARLTRVAGASARTVSYDSAKVWVAWQGDPSLMDTVWIDGLLAWPKNGVWGAWVEPAPGAAVGVELRARTRDGIWIEDRVEVVRQARIPAPSLVPLPGCDPKVVPFDSLRATVGWQEDSGRVDSVWIDGAIASRTENGSYLATLDLSRSVGTRDVVVRAKRGDLVFRDTIQVERKADTLPPVVSLGASRFESLGDSVRLSATWVVSDNDAVDSVWIDGQPVGRVGNTFSRTWMVDSARRSVDILAKDRSGNRSRDSLKIPRMVDSLAPALVRMPGTLSRTVSVDTTIALVAWKVTDNLHLKSVWIGDSLVAGQGNVFATQVPLVLGENVIRIRAMDAAGNVIRDSIVVRRESPLPPRLVRVAPHGSDTTVHDATDSLDGIWDVFDPVGLSLVTIAGIEVKGKADRYGSRVAVPYGKSRVRLRAVNNSGLASLDSFLVVRMDLIAPRLQLVGPTRDTLLDGQTDSVVVTWKASDNWGIKSMEIGGVAVAPNQGVYTRKVPLLWGWNTVHATAYDSAGNSTHDSVDIERAKPVGLRLYRDLPSLADSVVNEADSLLEVAYFVSSPARIDTMLIDNGSAKKDANGEYRRTVPLAIGMNRIVVLVADHDGNRKLDTVKVRRRDQTKPVLVRQPGTTTKQVDSSTASITLSWKATDNVAVKRLMINGVQVTPTSDIYSRTVTLGMGANYFTVAAFDAEGNVVTDTVVITRSNTVVSVPARLLGSLARAFPQKVEPTLWLASEERGWHGRRRERLS